MSQIKKLYKKIKENPKNVRFEEIDKILKYFGFEAREPGSGSSHITYSHADLEDILTIPKGRPHIKAVYVKKALKLIELLDVKFEDEEE
ncbi:HicA toxin of toxin-antitoxin [Thermoanaerobacter thermohydrosulfuricus]|uniref:YcfA-like protein n=2 Tax=Thermoanaerobacter TaxID=1754 RepID=I9ADE3_9THEO|nr:MULTISPECIES: type II toxin-antitoxin system HicA family toxin [Thermoanaerobacter]EGD52323.1 YcfA family protein [Thermoanaerobacter ethanolicus JW 200]HHY80307.1 type II toxin-antitoxin system HicA family toxin [Thermoanaerobacter sp.]EIW00037.1 YcfA-like protein [Thermoanaerobacter siderophilus SR4]UZQ82809.1 type II toxin-antitoxin system HicA family toxin [Thermoanaerobacter sp. RKWS2]SDF12170.1 HicA toxin of toxin-antitoxin [Thermoanaerobacter thermohydrosulfuricus]